jgi:hypothetical protein
MQTWKDIDNLTDYAIIALGWEKSEQRAFKSVITNAPLTMEDKIKEV